MERLPSRTSALLASRATKTRRWRGTRHGPPRRGIAAGTDARWNWAASPPRNYFIVSPGIPTGTSPRGGPPGPYPVARPVEGSRVEARWGARYTLGARDETTRTRGDACPAMFPDRSAPAAGRVAPTGGSLAIGSRRPALSSLRRPARPRKHRAIRPNRFSIRHKARPGIRWLSLRTPSDRIQTRSSIQRDSRARFMRCGNVRLRACGTGRAWAAASLTLLRSTIAAIHVYRQLPRRKRTQHGHVGHMHLIIVHLFARGFYPLTFLKGAISHS